MLTQEERLAEQEKMMGEIKLYWTVQIAVAAGFGFLVSNAVPKEKLVEDPVGHSLFVISMVLCVSFIGVIGFAYNLLGTYYIFVSRERVGRSAEHKVSVTTPIINQVYHFVVTLCWAMAVYFVLSNLINNGILPEWLSFSPLGIAIGMVLGGLIGYLIFYWVGRSLVKEFAGRNANYISYAAVLFKYYRLPLAAIFKVNVSVLFDGEGRQYIASDISSALIEKYKVKMKNELGSRASLFFKNKDARDGKGKYHLTVINPKEFIDLNLSEMQVRSICDHSVEIALLGLGVWSADNGSSTFYVVAKSKGLIVLRGLLGLKNEYYPHITLGFDAEDIHDVPKGEATLV